MWRHWRRLFSFILLSFKLDLILKKTNIQHSEGFFSKWMRKRLSSLNCKLKRNPKLEGQRETEWKIEGKKIDNEGKNQIRHFEYLCGACRRFKFRRNTYRPNMFKILFRMDWKSMEVEWSSVWIRRVDRSLNLDLIKQTVVKL